MGDENALSSDAGFMDKYSRQIGVFGLETMAKLVKLKVLVVGMRGVGVETCKNLILAGPGEVTLHDDEPVVIGDLGANFFLVEGDVGKPRAQCVSDKLQSLNSAVTVNVHSGGLSEELVGRHHVVVFSNTPKDQLLRWNAFCHNHSPPITFINCDVRGAAGFVFSDFGPEYTVRDASGEAVVTRVVKHVSSEEKGVVTLVGADEDGKRHELPDSDHDGWVEISDVEGMPELGAQPRRIEYVYKEVAGKDGKTRKVFDAYSVSIGDTRSLGTYGGGGVLTQVKKPVVRSHRSLAENIPQPVAPGEAGLMFTDGAKFGRAEQLHVAFTALQDYELSHGRLPPLNDAAAAAELLELARSNNARLAEAAGEAREAVLSLEEVDEQVVTLLARCAELEFQPLSCFFGGVVAQEVVKACGKFTPLNQWLHLDCFEVLPDKVPTDAQLKGSRYDGVVGMFGQSLHDRLLKLNTFLVGCGALGCELLKNFALLGVACGEGGLITVTDNDRIEVSNLNRQFLFREHNVHQPKSTAAAAAVLDMNPAIRISARETLVAPHTEDIFDDGFWEKLDVVTNALDNVKARNYVDGQCVFYSKPLLESGTLGTKCNVQVVVPHLTQSYSDGPKDAADDNIPMCTLRNFPSLIEHCIEWARAQFEDLFVVPFNDPAKFVGGAAAHIARVRQASLEHPNSAVGGANVAKELQKMQELKRQLEAGRGMTYEGCVRLAFDLFHDLFRDRLLQLQHSFPEDHTLENGTKFWSGAKRFPKAAVFDPSVEEHMSFVIAAANLLAVGYGLTPPPSSQLVAATHDWRQRQFTADLIAGQAMAPKEWVPSGEKVAGSEEEMKAQEAARASTASAAAAAEGSQAQEAEELGALLGLLASMDTTGLAFEPADFEKDEDANFHIDFVTAAANLRAWNYRIRQTSRHQVKMIAGKIIPAIATTTASVTGLVMVELLKVVQGKPLEALKDSSNSLGMNLYLSQEPMPPSKAKDEYDPIEMSEVKCRPSGFTKWDKTVVSVSEANPSLTLRQFLEAFKQATGGLHATLLYHKVAAQDPPSAVSGRMLYNTLEHRKEVQELYASKMDTLLTDWIRERYEVDGVKVLTPGRTYVELEVSCEDDDDTAWKVPPVVFHFKV